MIGKEMAKGGKRQGSGRKSGEKTVVMRVPESLQEQINELIKQYKSIKKVVSFSGGRTSAYLCYLMKQKFGNDVDFIFMDTGAEHPKTYEFIKQVNKAFDLNLTCIRGDFSKPLGDGVGVSVISIDEIGNDLVPWSEMMKKYGVPYIGGMFCSSRMKERPFKKYCDEKYGVEHFETWLGIRADEPTRIKEKKGIRYLAEISDFDKQDVLNWWKEQEFDLDIPEHLGNCLFCPKKSNLKLAAASRDEPLEYERFIETINGESVRVDEKTGRAGSMYRGKKGLQQVIAMFKDSSADEIKMRIRGAKMEDAGSCSESCEAMMLDDVA